MIVATLPRWLRRTRHRIARSWQPIARRAAGSQTSSRAPVRAAISTWAAVRWGRLFVALEDWGRADRAFRRALHRDPQHLEALLGAARSHLHVGPLVPTADPRLGVVVRPAGLATEAIAAAALASDLAPADPRPWTALLVAQRRAGDWGGALATAERAVTRVVGPGTADLWFERGFDALLAGRRAGGYTPEMLERATAGFRGALEREPSHVRARFHLVRLAAQHGDWDVALEAAWPDPPRPIPTDPEQLFQIAASVGTAPVDFWYAAAWRQHAAGSHRNAALLRMRMAEAMRCGRRHVSFGAGIDDAQAAIVLGDLDAARTRLRWLHADFPRSTDRLAVAKLAADVALRSGDPTPLRRWAAVHAHHAAPAAEAAFNALVRGHRIAIVGPGTEDVDDLRTNHDVVVRTKFVAGGHTAPADIAYYTDSSAAVLAEQIDKALTSDALHVAVVRPSVLATLAADGLPARSVRIAPFEDLGCFQATHFAIGRIAYDLLGYEPASITVLNVDLFTNPYTSSYQADRALYRARRFVPVTPGFGHDLAGDHVFLGQLASNGLIDAPGRLGHVLGLETTAYLASVEAAQALSPGADR